MKRIICIGNRYAPQDAAGPRVYESLLQSALPPNVQVIDGGLAGLDLLRFVEGAERVVFVDQISGFRDQLLGLGGQVSGIKVADGGIFILEAAAVVALAAKGRYGHSAGLAYLLRVLPKACEGPVPHVKLVGIEGYPDQATIDRAATIALQIVNENDHQSL
jgi:Ni,Fe-hydrogenase maturation factor